MNFTFPSEDLKTVPFDGSESLLFVKETDTVKLDCWKKGNELVRVYPEEYDEDYYLVENSSALFTGEDLDLDLRIYARSPYHDYPLFSISFRDGKDEIFGCTKYWQLPLTTETFYDTQWIEDSLTIQGFTYRNLYCDSITCPGLNNSFNLYYTKEYGLVKYEYKDGRAWELMEIDWGDNIAP